MTTGYQNSSGVDLDNIFDPYVEGTKPPATGYQTSDGVDLNQRFAPLSFGSAAAATGLQLSNGADLNTLWAAKGTASYAPFDVSVTPASAAWEEARVSGTSGANTFNPVNVFASGGSGSYSFTWEKVSGDTFTFSSIPPSGGAQASYYAAPSGVNTTTGRTYTGVYRCRVNDGTGEAVTNNFTLTYTRYVLNLSTIGTFRYTTPAPGNQSVHGIEIMRDGTSAGQSGSWVTPASATVGDKFEVRFDLVGGSPLASNPPAGTYGALSEARSCNVSSSGSASLTVKVTIRGGTIPGATATRDINLFVPPP